ncbi:MAG TPA: transglutaminaseTgpA domain-containing protein [Gaiellaceae bacterium]|nr:transglutaminaseTgpA domain-containing protein [Gaiellaceae bacterium]
MRSAARTVAVSFPAVVVIAVAWLRLEQPVGSLWPAVALLVLALAAALPRRRWQRGVAAVAATLLAARVAVGVDLVPWRLDRPGSGFSALGTRFGDGFDDFYGTHLPFDPRVHAAMHELVLSGVFLFALGVALLAAERKPIASALMLLVGAGWPTTLLNSTHGVVMGAAILGAALVLLAGLGSRRLPGLALPAAAVVVVAAIVVGSATAARHGLVNWQSWNLAHVAGGPTDVGFVWNSQYGGLTWSGQPTTVLQVQSAQPPAYLRATVLDFFDGNAWVAAPIRSADWLEPAAAKQPKNQTREVVTVDALADAHLAGGSIPIRFEAANGAPLVTFGPGFAALNQNLPQGFRYTVWSYTPRTSPTALRRSPASYPRKLALEGLLDVGNGETMPAFGTADRQRNVLSFVAVRPQLRAYLPLARLAEKVAGGARTPYGAVEDLEKWFVASGTFHYSNHPPVIQPALNGFVSQTHVGYCQYFAGAMALMLRYLGIPARVAVGFAGGSYDPTQRVWNVSDREAHAWVEVWFKGYGWLPFDPTPAAPGAAPRQTQAGLAVAGKGLGGLVPSLADRKGGGPSPTEVKLGGYNGFGQDTGSHRHNTSPATAGGGGSGDRSRPVLILLAVVSLIVAGIALTKSVFRLTRSARRDPRGVAAACRQELAAFLLDQRVETPRSATLGELGELVKREFGVSPEAFVAAATEARFGPVESAAAASHTARRELRSLLAAARRGLTFRDRLRGLFSLRSLTRPVAT